MSNEPLEILLAEDDDGHSDLVQRNLARAGIVNGITRVRDGQEALDYVRREGKFVRRASGSHLLILLDVKMPRVDGIEVLRRLKANEETAALPVVMLTTTDNPQEVHCCYELGCNVYILKPVKYDAFVEAIRRLGLLLQIVRLPRETE